MISKLSNHFAGKLLSNGTINDEDKELYDYGLFMLLSHAFFFIIACVFGLIFKCLIESLIFYLSFMLIRRYAGGYHAKTELRCELSSTVSIAVCIGIIKLSKVYNISITLLCAALICAVLIFVLCPLDTPEKPLSKKEYKHFRKISRILLICIVIAIIISFYFKLNIILAPCCAGLILEGILISAGKLKKIYNEKTADSH